MGTGEKKFQIFLAKTVVSVKGVLEDEKVSDSFVQNGPNCQGGTGEKKVSELFGQTAHFPPVGTEEKKFPKKRTTSPVFVQ